MAEHFSISRDILIDNILYNSTDARLEMDENARFKPEGNTIDCCLLEFL